MSDEELFYEAHRKAVLSLLLILLAGVITAGLASLLASQTTGFSAAIGIGGLIFLSSAALGAFLGFLFGVPRVHSKDASPNDAAGLADKQDRPPMVERVLSSNTNLERISDWLTTMLVGVGLSQLTNVPGALNRFGGYLDVHAKVFTVNGQPTAGALPGVGPFVLIFGAICGFLFMYLHTRLVLVRLFDRTERGLAGPPLVKAEKKAVQELALAVSDSPTAAKVRSDAPASVDDALQVMFDALYQPGGYRQVIELAGKLADSPLTKRAAYWFYLAAAFGQQMKEAMASDDSAAVQSARDNALDAARRAVGIDSSYRARLWNISDTDGVDNDLSALREDDDFKRLVGRR